MRADRADAVWSIHEDNPPEKTLDQYSTTHEGVGLRRDRSFLAFALPVSGEPGPAVRDEDGKYFDKADVPTYSVKEDGTVDWYTYSGFRRYHSECHVCHGPDGEGSSYAPGLKESLKTHELSAVPGSHRQRQKGCQRLAEFGDARIRRQQKRHVLSLTIIYVYLKARSDEAVPRGRPAKRADKPATATNYEKDCL